MNKLDGFSAQNMTNPTETIQANSNEGFSPVREVGLTQEKELGGVSSYTPEVTESSNVDVSKKTYQDIIESTISDNGNTLPGDIVNQDWLTGLLKKSLGNLGPDIRAISKN